MQQVTKLRFGWQPGKSQGTKRRIAQGFQTSWSCRKPLKPMAARFRKTGFYCDNKRQVICHRFKPFWDPSTFWLVDILINES
jgi:hypothetical protein